MATRVTVKKKGATKKKAAKKKATKKKAVAKKSILAGCTCGPTGSVQRR
jgi:hypothetical protein